MREMSDFQAAGGGAFLLAIGALLATALAVVSIRRGRGAKPPRFTFRIALVAMILTWIFLALALSANAATHVGVRSWTAAEHGSENLLELADRAVAQLARGKAILRVAVMFVWAPLVGSTVALFRVATKRTMAYRVAAVALSLPACFGTVRLFTSQSHDPYSEARAIIVPRIVEDMKAELQKPMNETSCKRYASALAVCGRTRLQADVPDAPSAAKACMLLELKRTPKDIQRLENLRAVRRTQFPELAPEYEALLDAEIRNAEKTLGTGTP